MSKLTELQKQFLEVDRKIKDTGDEKQLKERSRILRVIAEEKKAQVAREIGGLKNGEI